MLRDKVRVRIVENGFIIEYQNNVYNWVERFETNLKDVQLFLKDYWKYTIEERDLGIKTQ